MSYRIEITAASLEELADKALALGGRLLAVRTPSASAQAPAVETLSPVIATVAPEPETAPEPVRTETAAPSLDYKTEVAPLVLKLVELRGKPTAQHVLDQFGAVKASDIPSERWPELVAMINDEIAQ